jgi:hypothetical protein
MRGWIVVTLTAIGVASVASGCRRQAAPPVTKSDPQIVWRPVGSWSGHGNRQTESFHGETGALRVTWEARDDAAAGGKLAIFRLTAHSAISGRVLAEVVDRQGAGSGVGYVSTEPHTFYISVESAGLGWTFSVDEGYSIPSHSSGRSVP